MLTQTAWLAALLLWQCRKLTESLVVCAFGSPGTLQRSRPPRYIALADDQLRQQAAEVCPTSLMTWHSVNTCTSIHSTGSKKGKASPYLTTERRVSELGSQPAGDVSHKPGGRLPLLSPRLAVTPATLKRAATNFAAWWTDAQWVWAVCLRLLSDSAATAIWTRAFCAWVQHANHSATEPPSTGSTRLISKQVNGKGSLLLKPV